MKKSIIAVFYSVLFTFLCMPIMISSAQEDDPSRMAVQDEELGTDFNYFFTDEYMDVRVDVASLFEEEEMVIGATVSRITSGKWKKLGARRAGEALNNEMSVMTYPLLFGSYAVTIRGYANSQAGSSVAVTLDGAPLNDITTGAALYNIQNWELGTLDSIELIKGPGSAIYGTDAFSGVMSMKTFESDRNSYSAELAGAYPLYGDANFKVSQGFAGDLVRIDAAVSSSRQADQDIEYAYNDGGITGTGKRAYKYDSASGVFKITYSPFDKLKVKAGSYASYWNCDGFPATAIIPANLRSKDLSAARNLFMMGNGSIVYYFENKTSIAVQGYLWNHNGDSDTIVNPNGNYLFTRNINSRGGFQVMLKQPANSLNLQWLLAYSFEHYKLSRFDREIRYNNGDLFMKIEQQNPEGFSRNINSGFSQIKWGAIRDRLYFLVGGRVDNYSDFGFQNTPRGGIIYLPTKNDSVKALYGRAFKAPNTSQLFGMPSVIDGEPDLEPETIDNYELIYMHQEKKWKSTLSGFYSFWKNGIISETTESSDPEKYVNKGKNLAYGGEFSLYMSHDPFAADLGFSYVKSRALDVVDPDHPSVTEDQDYAAFPEYSANAGIYYVLKSYDINFFLNNRLYLAMAEAPFDQKVNPDDLPPYYRMDLNINKIVSDKLDIYLDIRNILNNENYLPSVMGARKGYEEPGISVLLRAGYKW